jgi:hypothetical protein
MSRLRTLAASLALTFVAAAPAAAQVVTVDFSNYRSPETVEYQATPGDAVNQFGFVFTAHLGNTNTTPRNVLGTWGTEDLPERLPSNLGPTAAALFNTVGGDRIDMFREDGFGFNLFSMDVAHAFPRSFLGTADLLPITLFFYGFNAAGQNTADLVQSFVIEPPALVGGEQTPILRTIMFNENFRNLSGLAWFQQSGPFNAGNTGVNVWHQFTNVRAETVVPEPSTYVLMGAGLVGVLAMARRRRADA